MPPKSKKNDVDDNEIIFIGAKPPSSSRPQTMPFASPDIELIDIVKPNNNNITSSIANVEQNATDIQILDDLPPFLPSTNNNENLSSIFSVSNDHSPSSSLLPSTEDAEKSRCMICLESFGEIESQHQMVTMKCGHIFGKECIEKWLKNNPKCPTCKRPARKSQIIKLYADSLPPNQTLWMKYKKTLDQLEELKKKNDKLMKQMKSKKM